MKRFRIKKEQRVMAAAILASISFVLMKVTSYEILTVFLMIITTFVAGTPIFKKAIGALRFGIVGIDALVTIAVIGALIIGEYWEAAAVTFLFVLGDYLESRTIEKTRSSIKALLDLAPMTARVKRENGELEIPSDEVTRGDMVIVKPGEKIPVDGIVSEGSAYVNQSAITGEPIPVDRNEGGKVFSGTVIESGYLIIRALEVGEDTTFARILQMVEDAQDKKAKTQKLLERFSRIYTPAVVVLSLIVFLLTKDLVIALTLLVIACPGALVISAPVSMVAGIGNGAKRGILIKGGDIMEKLGTIKAIAFDKTGTLTQGKPLVARIKSYKISESELLSLAATGESYSEHPIGKAIIAETIHRSLEIDTIVEKPNMIPGHGIIFKVKGHEYFLGNRKLFRENSIDIKAQEFYLKEEENKGRTAVILGDAHGILGVISIADVVREEAHRLISQLRNLGIQHLVMLTGDNKRTAAELAAELNLDGYYAELLPENKVEVLKKLQLKYGRTAMVGDGINDAPALASADLGIAIGGVGSDVAMETADVVLMSAEVEKLAYAIGLSRATVRNMKQNIYFALLVAALLLAGVLIKTVNLSFGMLIHEISVLLVILNATRLIRYRKISNPLSRKNNNEVFVSG